MDPGQELLEAVAARAQADLVSYSAQNVSNTLWAFARLGFSTHSFMGDAMSHVLTHLSDFSPQSVVRPNCTPACDVST